MGDRLKGRNIVVTGAGSGIGAGVAADLADNGANVVVADINPERVQTAVLELSQAAPCPAGPIIYNSCTKRGGPVPAAMVGALGCRPAFCRSNGRSIPRRATRWCMPSPCGCLRITAAMGPRSRASVCLPAAPSTAMARNPKRGTQGALSTPQEVRNDPMLWALVILLLLLWIGGFTLNVAGGLIHLLLVFAVISIIWHLVAGRRATV